MKVIAETYRTFSKVGDFPYPITLRFWQTNPLIFPAKLTFVEAFVDGGTFLNGDGSGKGRMYIQLDGRVRSAISPFPIQKLGSNDPNFNKFLSLTLQILELLIKGWNSRRLQPRVQLIGDPHAQKNYLDESLDYITWKLKKIKETGDVEDGAEAVLRTEQGQEMLKEAPMVSDKLKEEMKELTDHVRADDQTRIEKAKKARLDEAGFPIPESEEALGVDYTEEDLSKK